MRAFREGLWPIVRHALILAALIPIALILLLIWGYNGGLYKMCEITTHRTILSPDLSHRAIIFDEHCLAVAKANVQLSIIDAFDNLDFTANPNVYIDWASDLDAYWVSDKILEVSLPRYGDIARKDNHVGDVEIRYKPYPETRP